MIDTSKMRTKEATLNRWERLVQISGIKDRAQEALRKMNDSMRRNNDKDFKKSEEELQELFNQSTRDSIPMMLTKSNMTKSNDERKGMLKRAKSLGDGLITKLKGRDDYRESDEHQRLRNSVKHLNNSGIHIVRGKSRERVAEISKKNKEKLYYPRRISEDTSALRDAFETKLTTKAWKPVNKNNSKSSSRQLRETKSYNGSDPGALQSLNWLSKFNIKEQLTSLDVTGEEERSRDSTSSSCPTFRPRSMSVSAVSQNKYGNRIRSHSFTPQSPGTDVSQEATLDDSFSAEAVKKRPKDKEAKQYVKECKKKFEKKEKTEREKERLEKVKERAKEKIREKEREQEKEKEREKEMELEREREREKEKEKEGICEKEKEKEKERDKKKDRQRKEKKKEDKLTSTKLLLVDDSEKDFMKKNTQVNDMLQYTSGALPTFTDDLTFSSIGNFSAEATTVPGDAFNFDSYMNLSPAFLNMLPNEPEKGSEACPVEAAKPGAFGAEEHVEIREPPFKWEPVCFEAIRLHSNEKPNFKTVYRYALKHYNYQVERCEAAVPKIDWKNAIRKATTHSKRIQRKTEDQGKTKPVVFFQCTPKALADAEENEAAVFAASTADFSNTKMDIQLGDYGNFSGLDSLIYDTPGGGLDLSSTALTPSDNTNGAALMQTDLSNSGTFSFLAGNSTQQPSSHIHDTSLANVNFDMPEGSLTPADGLEALDLDSVLFSQADDEFTRDGCNNFM
eukprot:Nk52_evm55s217 gene=Nk52_evmTU55s217